MFRITWLHRPFYPLASISQFHWIQTIVWTQTLNIAFFPRISQLNIRDMQFLKEKKKRKEEGRSDYVAETNCINVSKIIPSFQYDLSVVKMHNMYFVLVL